VAPMISGNYTAFNFFPLEKVSISENPGLILQATREAYV
jgi:hypothetical protein